MGSHFGISTSRRKSPSYCIKGLWEAIDSYSDARPISINAYVKWYDTIGTDFLDFTETLLAWRNATNDGYIAWSAKTPPRIGLAIDDTPNRDLYDVTIYVDLWGWIEYSHTFEDVDVTQRPPWGTGLLTKVWIAGNQYLETRLLA